MNKPARLQKPEPITVSLTPDIFKAGVILIFLFLLLAVGSIENYNFLLSGV